MTAPQPASDRADIVAATRGADDSLGMEGEADIASGSIDQALYGTHVASFTARIDRFTREI
jgi:hypothetical protein